ncbi:MAG: permease [Candidatus Saccharimonadia bacterium]
MIIYAIWHALTMSFAMGWEILWPLILGFGLSGAIQTVVSHKQMSVLLPDDKPKTIAKASLLGAASSSCSYAAVALARSIFKKGGNFTSAMAFEMASTNLVIELGIIMALLLGWQFTAAEFVGGPIMIALLAIIFRRFLKKRLVQEARAQTDKGLVGRMEGHAAMDSMAVESKGTIWQKLISQEGRTATSHFFVMDWVSIWTDIVLGLLIAGALAAWVPQHVWQSVFFVNHPLIADIWGPLVGPLIAVVSFVCSIGNVPLAAVLWNGGISFGGVVSFIFADLIIIPIIRIYAKYYGWKMAGFLFVAFYAAMTIAGYIIEALFAVLHLTPHFRNAKVFNAAVSWNYTSVLNIIFLAAAAALVWRFLRTGGPMMLKMMRKGTEDQAQTAR